MSFETQDPDSIVFIYEYRVKWIQSIAKNMTTDTELYYSQPEIHEKPAFLTNLKEEACFYGCSYNKNHTIAGKTLLQMTRREADEKPKLGNL